MESEEGNKQHKSITVVQKCFEGRGDRLCSDRAEGVVPPLGNRF